MSRSRVPGTIYLLHFDEPVAHAQHYLGWTEHEVVQRMRTHERGEGSPLVRALVERGGTFCLANVWRGDRHLERKLKNRRNARRLCPVCAEGDTADEIAPPADADQMRPYIFPE